MKPSRLLLCLAVVSGCADNLSGPPLDANVPDTGTPDTGTPDAGFEIYSIARQWDEAILRGIRRDLPRPPVHARNLFHLSAGMYDAWCAYDATCDGVFVQDKLTATDVAAARREAISYAAYRILHARYEGAIGGAITEAELDAFMDALGYPISNTSTTGDTPSALGNRIANTILTTALADGSRESENYFDPTYLPVNAPMIVKLPGAVMVDPNRWQPLSLDYMVAQNGVPIPATVQSFVAPHWNAVDAFALTRTNPNDLYVDPGPPPLVGTAELRDQVVEVIRLSGQLDPADPTTIDLSPSLRGNDPVGTNAGSGHGVNPFTGQPYAPNVVLRADFRRALSEFWADGPHSETPPGHWNVVANEVSDHPDFVPRLGGTGPTLDRLEWDVKLYLALNGAAHDASIAAWGIKRAYDSSRPISLIRYLGGLGQSTDPTGPSYHVDGLPLIPGVVELVTAESSAPGERHEALAASVGKVAVFAWPGQPANPASEISGCVWQLAENWIAYQRKTFVTPAFAGYISGHSTYSRAAAEVLAAATGSTFFPGGLYTHEVPASSFVHEFGPTAPFVMQWATYYDAASDAGRSRLMSGIHILADDFAGRTVGQHVGLAAWAEATRHFSGSAVP